MKVVVDQSKAMNLIQEGTKEITKVVSKTSENNSGEEIRIYPVAIAKDKKTGKEKLLKTPYYLDVNKLFTKDPEEQKLLDLLKKQAISLKEEGKSEKVLNMRVLMVIKSSEETDDLDIDL